MSIRKYGRYWVLYDDASKLVCACLYTRYDMMMMENNHETLSGLTRADQASHIERRERVTTLDPEVV